MYEWIHVNMCMWIYVYVGWTYMYLAQTYMSLYIFMYVLVHVCMHVQTQPNINEALVGSW